MSETWHRILAEHPLALSAAVTAVAGTVAYVNSPHYKLRHIPSVGSSSWPLLSYLGAKRYFANALQYYQEGYDRYNGGMFKVATMEQYIVMVTGRTLIRELAALPDDTMSFPEAIQEITQQKYVLSHNIMNNPFENDIVKRDLTRNLAALFPEIYDEVAQAFEEHMPDSKDWISVAPLNIIMMVVARASNRVIVGLPHCRNQQYLEKSIRYTQMWFETTRAISKYPAFMKPFVAPFLNKLPATVDFVSQIIGPEIDRRRQLMSERGSEESSHETNDILAWMMAHTHGNPSLDSTNDLVHRLLRLNFVAIHTSSSTFAHALYTLAAEPALIEPLRKEIQTVIQAEGISKASLKNMVKLDSFFRECNRRHCMMGLIMMRKALKGHVFSDGTYVPAGTIIGVPSIPHHLNQAIYEEPDEVNPARFENAKGSEAIRKYFTSIDSEYLAFGMGKHACPGRFFAGNELKVMMCHLLLNYDVRAEVEGIRPPNMHLGHVQMPNAQGKVMFRKRQT